MFHTTLHLFIKQEKGERNILPPFVTYDVTHPLYEKKGTKSPFHYANSFNRVASTFSGNVAFSGNVPSGVVTVNNFQNETTLFPNPANGSTTLFCNRSSSGNAAITITDIKGSVVQRISTHTMRGANSFTLDLSHMSQGIYFVKIADDEGVEEKKLIVE